MLCCVRSQRHCKGHLVVVILTCDMIVLTKHGADSWNVLQGTDLSDDPRFCDVIIQDSKLVDINCSGDIYF